MSAADFSMHGAIAVIQLNNPPMNTLAHPLRQAVYENLQKGVIDPDGDFLACYEPPLRKMGFQNLVRQIFWQFSLLEVI